MSHQDPYGNQPQQPYGGGQGFGSAPGYPAPPQPPRKRTGLIIGAIVAALVVVAGLVIGGIVLLGGEDDDKKETSSATDEASDEPTEEPSDEPTEEPTDEPTEEPTDGGTEVLGTNYTYSLPDAEWQDLTADITAGGTAVDSGVVWGDSLEAGRANVLVEAGPSEGASLEEHRDAWETNLTSGGGPELERLPDVTIDGEKGYAVQRQGTNSSGSEIFQTVYLTLHQEIVYSISFTSGPADDEAEAGFDVIKSSWAWVS